MVHRLAELFREVELAKSPTKRRQAQQDCESLILRLWERRSSWPNGWPPRAALEALQSFSKEAEDSDAFRRRRVDPVPKDVNDVTGLEILVRIADLKKIEGFAFMQVAYATADVEGGRRLLREAGSAMTQEERDAIEETIKLCELTRASLKKRRFSAGATDDDSEDLDLAPVVNQLRDCAAVRTALTDILHGRFVTGARSTSNQQAPKKQTINTKKPKKPTRKSRAD